MMKPPMLPFVTVLLASAALAGESSRDLREMDSEAEIDVIVQYRDADEAVRDRKAASKRGRKMKNLDGARAGVYRMKTKDALNLANDPSVVNVSPDREVFATLDYAAAAVNADAAANYSVNGVPLTGTGIGVAVIDSGIVSHQDLTNSSGATRIVYHKSWINNNTSDVMGHGTHIAGIIGGNGSSAKAPRVYKGIAPGVNLINLRVLDGEGRGTESNVIAAIDHAISIKSTYNIRVINLSLGRGVFQSYSSDPLCQAVERAWNAGIVVVVAAGNDGRNNSANNRGYGTINAPGNDPYVITVGGMKANGTAARGNDTLASYSSKGPSLIDHVVKPDLVAPGNRTASLVKTNFWLYTTYSQTVISDDTANATKYYRLNGTSMATPVVSGAVALMLQKNPSLTPAQVKARLMKTAYKGFPASSVATDAATNNTYTSYYDVFSVGAGYLDIGAALANNESFSGSAMSPKCVYNASTDTGLFSFFSGSGLGGTNLTWGTNIVWGTSAVSGSNIVWGVSTSWANNIVWGVNGFNIVWGVQSGSNASNIIWGTQTTAVVEGLSVLVNGDK